MIADYPGAIVVEADQTNYGYGAPNHPVAWCLHTPEEPADNNPSTPYYFHNAKGVQASTTYFVSYLGFVFQCVPESEGAYANAVQGKVYPNWANSGVNLNLQTLSIEIEGFASNIAQTMPRGSAQWKALVALMAHRCKALGIDPNRTFGHFTVSIFRSDPGSLDIAAVVADVKTAMQGDTMSSQEFTDLSNQLTAVAARLAKIENDAQYVRFENTAIVWKVNATELEHIGTLDHFAHEVIDWDQVKIIRRGTTDWDFWTKQYNFAIRMPYLPTELLVANSAIPDPR